MQSSVVQHGRIEDQSLRDVVALSTLPSLWRGADALRIAESLAAALYTTLNPEFVCVCFIEDPDKAPVCVVQTGRHETSRSLAEKLYPAFRAWAKEHDPDELLIMPNVTGGGEVRVTTRVLGVGAGGGLIAAGFSDEDAPTPVQHLLLNVGASQAASAIQNAQLLHSLRETVAEREEKAKALLESERQVRQLLESSPDCIQLLDTEGRLLFINDIGLRLLEMEDASNLLNKHWVNLWSGEERIAAEQALEAARSGKTTFFQGACTTGRGRLKWWDIIVSPVLDVTGQSKQLLVVSRDISQRKRTEDAITRITAASEKRRRLYETALSSTPDLVYVFDLNHRFTFANETLLKMWGRTWDEAIGKNCLELGYEPWHAELHDREIEQVVATKQSIRGEVPFTGTNGRRIYDYIFVPVLGLDGEVEAVAGTTRDVTERKRAEMNSEFLASISKDLARLNDVDELMTTIGARIGAFFDLSHCAFVEVYEAEDKVVITHNWHRQDVPEIIGTYRLQEYLSDDFQKAGRNGEIFIVRDTVKDPRTDEVRFAKLGIESFVCVPLVREQQWRFLLCIYHSTPYDWREDEIDLIRELTTRIWNRLEGVRAERHLEEIVAQRTAKLQEIIGELEAFSYSISHDMRAPLRAMQGFAGLLETDFNDKLDETGRDYIRRIVTSAERMDRLIQDVLTYSRVTRTECELKPIDLDRLVRGILESYPHLQAPHACILVDGQLPAVLGNEAALTQCFSNLMGNAVKFVSPGTVPQIRVWAEENGSDVRVLVRDNGIGIPEEYQDRIFGIFQRMNKDYEGTGIGLAIVKKAAERMNSRVGLESEPGKGSTFWLELKMASQSVTKSQ